MSELLRCGCGGQFVIPPQPNSSGWRCPHCGAVWHAPATMPAAPPIPPPLAAPFVAALSVPNENPQLMAPPVAISAEIPQASSSKRFSLSSRKRSRQHVWIVGAGGALSLLLVLVLMTLNWSSPRETVRDAPIRRRKVAGAQVPPTATAKSSERSLVPSAGLNAGPPDDSSQGKERASPAEKMASAVDPIPPPPGPPSLEVSELPGSIELPDRLAALMKMHCFECHDATKQEGGLRMDELAQRPMDGQSTEHWRKVLRRLKSEEMPPPEASSLRDDDRSFWVNWLQSELHALAERDPPRPTVRRLNRAEYVNTVRALTGLPLEPAAVVDDVVSAGFDTDAAELNLSPQLMRQYVQLARAIAVELRKRNARLPELKLKLFGDADEIREPNAIAEEARRRLKPFAEAAFRRPVEESKLERLTQIVVAKTAANQGFDDGMQLAVQAVLCSPQFLLLTDLNEVSDDYALAAKLSYFLWSSPPDAPLLELAAKQSLRDGALLRAQVTRMLKDPRCSALADNFGGQWLGTRELGIMQPDEEIFPGYSPLLEASFREETHRFFEYVLRQNLSIMTFIDADFTIANEPLALLYGIPGVRGNEFRKVSLNPQQHRGGVLTQGTMLSITSDGVRSSPVIRGVWILENILGDPPAPPPADVPDLESDTRGTKTIREELARHRNVESCNSCHRKIDPLGFALENYDAIGQWRTRYRTAEDVVNGVPVDNTGELPDGTVVVGVAQLKKVLLQRKRDFARCLAEKLLAYGCSRKLDFRDQAIVEKVVEVTAADEYRLQSLIQAIVQTPAFRGS